MHKRDTMNGIMQSYVIGCKPFKPIYETINFFKNDNMNGASLS